MDKVDELIKQYLIYTGQQDRLITFLERTKPCKDSKNSKVHVNIFNLRFIFSSKLDFIRINKKEVK